MLSLASATDDGWAVRVLDDLPALLVDHAHCEKKAAGAAIKLLFAYPHHRFLQEPLAELAREELEHFQQVLSILDARGVKYQTIRPSPYGLALHAQVRRDEPDRLLASQTIDTLEMLSEKTRGNLEDEERELLQSLLYELRMQFVKAGESG